MLYKFKSKNTGDVIMLEPHGRQVLEIIGKEAGPQGIILPEQMPAALLALPYVVGAPHITADPLAGFQGEAQAVLRDLGTQFVKHLFRLTSGRNFWALIRK